MGRQKGKQQRSRGNMAPSSSARSADLLSKESTSKGGLLFDAVSGGGFTNIPELDGLESITNPEFRITLKKLYKRDVTTKLKALNELCDLCESAQEEDVLSTLPYWPRVYNRLFEDPDRRVRESNQKAMHSIVKVVGKKLAPFLKNVMGDWFISQCDPYAPCAFAAEAGLSCAFKGEKKLGAFIFCREEMLKTFKSYLFSSLQQSVHKKVVEDEENNSHRIVACCLEAFSIYLNTVVKSEPIDCEIESILGETQFWKYQKHKNPTVRSSFYMVLESLCLVVPDILEKYLSEACRATFHRLDESNSSLIKPLYGASVALASTFNRWHEFVDINKSVLPSLCNSLRNSCHGMPSVILPSLLPLLDKFPREHGNMHVYAKVLENLHLGLERKSSQRNVNQMVAAFIQLLQLLVNKCYLGEVGNVPDVVQFVMKRNIIELLSLSIDEKIDHLATSSLYSLVGDAIHSWTNKQNVMPGVDLYSDLMACFWQEVHCMFCVRLSTSSKETDYALWNYLSFLQKLINPQMPQREKIQQKYHVRFQVDENHQETTETDKTPTNTVIESYALSEVQKKVNIILSETILSHSLSESNQIIKLYCRVFKVFGNKALFNMLVCQNLPKWETKDGANAYLNEILVTDIMDLISSWNITDRQEDLILLSDLIFNCLTHCENTVELPHALGVFFQGAQGSVEDFIGLRLLSGLCSTKLSNCFSWLVEEMNCDTTILGAFMKRLISSLASSDLKIISMNESNDRWKILGNLLTLSFEMAVGETIFVLSQKGFELVMNLLMYHWYRLSSSSECLKSFNLLSVNISQLLRGCVFRHFDISFLSENKTSIWLILARSFLRNYCLLEEENTDNISHLISCISSAVELPLDDNNPTSQVMSFILEEIIWMKENFMSPTKFSEDALCKLRNILEAFLTCKTMFDDCTLNAMMDQFLPDTEEWDRIRVFQPEKWCDSDIESMDDMLFMSEDLDCNMTDTETREYYISMVRAFSEFCCVFFSGKEGQVTLSSFPIKVQYLYEEMIISMVIADDDRDISFLNELSEEFSEHLRKGVFEKALQFGGIWPQCLRKQKSLTPRTACIEVVEMMDRYLYGEEKSEIRLPLMQTMFAISENLTSVELRNMTQKIVEYTQIKTTEGISQFDITLFSLGMKLLLHSCNTNHEILPQYFQQILDWRKQKESLFLFDCDFLSASNDLVRFNADVAHFFRLAIKDIGCQLSEVQWDFICCMLVSCFENIAECADEVDHIPGKLLHLLDVLLMLLYQIEIFMSVAATRDDPTVPNNLIPEWTEFFSSAVHSSVIRLFLSLYNSHRDQVSHGILSRICSCLRFVRQKDLISAVTHLKTKLSPKSNLPDEIQTLLHNLCPLLHPQSGEYVVKCLIQVGAYNLLKKLLPEISKLGYSNVPVVFSDIIKKSSDSSRIFLESSKPKTPKAIDCSSDSDLSENDENMMTEDLIHVPNMHEFGTPLLSYLLTWKLLIKFVRYILDEHKSSYIECLSKVHLSDDLLPKLFKLMPGKYCYFKTEPPEFYEEEIGTVEMEHIACSVYKEYLLEIPATARLWYNNLPKVARNRVDKFTTANVSPLLIERELKAIQSTKQQQVIEGMQIIARPLTREVYVTYKLNEADMEITVCLSPNHPLGPITVNTEKRAGVVIGQWRYWILQITTFLQYQNGGIIDGLLLWKDKVDKRFEGLEECMICFSLVHGSNQSLPKLKCKTCKKKYHAECLYKWFDTSNNSTCPLCRSPMIFR